MLKKAGSQAEFNMEIWNYLDQMVSDERISEGKAALADNAALLSRIEARYGVDRYTVVAIWGMESHYGAHLLQSAAGQEHHPVAGDARLVRRPSGQIRPPATGRGAEDRPARRCAPCTP